MKVSKITGTSPGSLPRSAGPVCDYSSSQKSKMKKHFEYVHENQKQHECSFCDYSFSHKDNLKRYNENVHEKQKPHK